MLALTGVRQTNQGAVQVNTPWNHPSSPFTSFWIPKRDLNFRMAVSVNVKNSWSEHIWRWDERGCAAAMYTWGDTPLGRIRHEASSLVFLAFIRRWSSPPSTLGPQASCVRQNRLKIPGYGKETIRVVNQQRELGWMTSTPRESGMFIRLFYLTLRAFISSFGCPNHLGNWVPSATAIQACKASKLCQSWA